MYNVAHELYSTQLEKVLADFAVQYVTDDAIAKLRKVSSNTGKCSKI